MYKINKKHLLRLKMYINLLESEAGKFEAPKLITDLKVDHKKELWVEACNLVKRVKI